MYLTHQHRSFRCATRSRISALLESLEPRCLLSTTAYELPPDTGFSTTGDAVAQGVFAAQTLPGDLNGDGRLDADDYYVIDQAYAQQEKTGKLPKGDKFALADLNGDGRIDAQDYFILDSIFLQQTLGAPAAPSDLAAEGLSTNEIEVAWADNSADETHFHVERSLDGSAWTRIATLPANATRHTDTLLQAGKKYFYRVCASNDNGHSGYSLPASSTTMPLPPLAIIEQPVAPDGLVAAPAGVASIQVQWNDRSADEDAFIIERQVNAGAWQPLATLAANATSHLDTGLIDGATYAYRVASRNVAGLSVFATSAPVALPLIAPTSLSATAVSTSQVNLAWADHSAGEGGYQVERKTGSTGAWALIATVGVNVTTFQDTGLSASTQYFYRVRATGGGGSSAWAAESSVTTLAVTPSTPTAPNAVSVSIDGARSIRVQWNDRSNNEDNFILERRIGTGAWQALATIPANVTSHLDAGLTDGLTYTYRVAARNAGGTSSFASSSATNLPLAAPTGLVATIASATQVNLAWTDNSVSETGYQVERKTGTGGTWALVATVGANVTSFQNTGLSASTQYVYRVRAAGSSSTSAYSAEASATTPATVPLAPDGTSAAIASATSIQLQWNDRSADESGFVIERQVNAGQWLALVTLPANATSYLNTNLTDGWTYAYRVAAVNSAGTSAFATSAAVALPLAAPTSLLATAASATQINLAWADNSVSETGYQIERKTGATGAWSLIATVGANVTGFQNTGLAASTQYFYRVRAAGSSSTSAYSAEAGATTPALTPAAPDGISAAIASATSIQLQWNDRSNNESGFVIERQVNAGAWLALATLPANATSYLNTGLIDGANYAYRVAATNSAGASPFATSGAIALPLVAPANLSAAAASTTQINLAWTDPSNGESGYQIERKTGSAGTWALVATVGANVTTFQNTGLAASTQYFYRVRATNGGGSSAWSAESSATTAGAQSPNAPAAPTAVAASVFSAVRIDLSWTDNSSDETGFTILRSTDGVNFAPVGTVAANITSYTDLGSTTSYDPTRLRPATQYYYRVRAENSAGSSFSPVFSATTLANSTVDAEGWTTIAPSADTRIVYVSSSEGNDLNDGLSAERPVKTIARGNELIRNGYPDWVLLKRGDTFSDVPPLPTVISVRWTKSGRSASEPALLGAYGTGPRPIVDTPMGGRSINIGTANDFSIVGIEFTSSQRNPQSPNYIGNAHTSGFFALNGGNYLVEDCKFSYFSDNMNIQGFNGVVMRNVSIRRNVVENAYNATGGHSQGAFIMNVENLLIEGNVFDHNGWNQEVAGAEPTIFNHNIYIQSDVRGAIVRDNIIANASSHGLQARPGGQVTGNLFINNPIGMSFGYVNGASATPGGVEGTVSNNVFIGTRDINGSVRGWAIEVSNIKAGAGTTIEHNIITGDTQNKFAAIHLTAGSVSNPNDAVGINDLTIRNNTIIGWNSAMLVHSKMMPGSTGQYAVSGLVVENNDFQEMLSTRIIEHGPAFNAQHEQWRGNRYWTSSDPATWFRVNNTTTSWNTWSTNVDTTGSSMRVPYIDPTRNLALYNASLGGSAAVEPFLAAAREQSRQNWNTSYSATSVMAYIAGGLLESGHLP